MDEIPSEYVSLRHVWLTAIFDCRSAIANRSRTESTYDKAERQFGDRAIADTVEALQTVLVDYGFATIKSEVDQYQDSKIMPVLKKIWDKYHSDDITIDQTWKRHADQSIKLFSFIIKTLNKYGMLFKEQPKGYTNVEMKSIDQKTINKWRREGKISQ